MKQKTKSVSSVGSAAVPAETREKIRFISVPARFILNEAGVSFFQKHDRPMRYFEDSGGASRYGFDMETIDLAWLKKMLLKGLVEKIEIEIQEIARTNVVLSDAVRLIFFSMFRHRITLSVLDHIYNSPMLRAYNRANPKRSIGPGVVLSKETIKAALKPLEVTVIKIQIQLRGLVVNRLRSIEDKWDDKNKLALFIEEIIQELDPLIFLILVGSKEKDRIVLINNIATQIADFANMVDLLDMASLLSIELASAAERSAMMRVMTQQNISDIFKVIPRLRHLMKENKFKGTTIVISIPRHMNKNKERLKFRLSFYNDAADADTERKLMEDFSYLNRRFVPEPAAEPRRGRGSPPVKDLGDFFYKEEVYGDNAMRCYYLSMLRQLCDRHNIIMDLGIRTNKHLSQDLTENAEASVTTLSFGL